MISDKKIVGSLTLPKPVRKVAGREKILPDPEVIISIITAKGNIILTARNSEPVPNARTDKIIPVGKGVKFGDGWIDLGSVITVVSSRKPYLYNESEGFFLHLTEPVPFNLTPKIFSALELNGLAIEIVLKGRDPEEVLREKLDEKEDKFRGDWLEARSLKRDLLFDAGELPINEDYEIYGGDPDLGIVFD